MKYRWYLLPPLILFNLVVASAYGLLGILICLVGWVCALIFTVGVNP